MSNRIIKTVMARKHFCDFCGKSQDEVELVVEGPCPAHAREPTQTTDICNECVDLCVEIIADQRAQKKGEYSDFPPG